MVLFLPCSASYTQEGSPDLRECSVWVGRDGGSIGEADVAGKVQWPPSGTSPPALGP